MNSAGMERQGLTLFRPSEAAAYLGIGKKKFRELIDQGAIAWIDLSAAGTSRRFMRFRQSDLRDFVEGRRAPDTRGEPEAPKKEPASSRAKPTVKRALELKRRAEFVYFFRSGPFVKIGTTRNIKSRLQNLQISHPTPIALVGTIPGGVRVERELHRRFASLRVNGEWFREVEDLAVYIANLGGDRNGDAAD
jgi:excisionase family DNA binding protein